MKRGRGGPIQKQPLGQFFAVNVQIKAFLSLALVEEI